MTVQTIKERAALGEVVIVDHIQHTEDSQWYFPDEFMSKYPTVLAGLTCENDETAEVMWVYNPQLRN